jgi:hypothetical protein
MITEPLFPANMTLLLANAFKGDLCDRFALILICGFTWQG